MFHTSAVHTNLKTKCLHSLMHLPKLSDTIAQLSPSNICEILKHGSKTLLKCAQWMSPKWLHNLVFLLFLFCLYWLPPSPHHSRVECFIQDDEKPIRYTQVPLLHSLMVFPPMITPSRIACALGRHVHCAARYASSNDVRKKQHR